MFEALPKVLVYASTQLVVGISTARLLLWQASRRAVDKSDILERRLVRIARIATSLILAALLARLAAHTFVSMGDLHAESVRLIALDSRWGSSWRIQISAAILQLGAGFALVKGGKSGWFAWIAASVFLSLTLPLLGHAGDSLLRFVVHSTHLLATSVWLGTLAVIVLLPATHIIPEFSPIALLCAPVTVITGTVLAFLYVQTPENLYATVYGQTLLLKIGLFAGILGCGWANWRRVRLGGDAPRLTLRAELLFAASVVIVTGILTEMAHP